MNKKEIERVKQLAHYTVGVPNRIARLTRYIRFTREEASFIHRTISMMMARIADMFADDEIVSWFKEDEQAQIKDALERLARLR